MIFSSKIAHSLALHLIRNFVTGLLIFLVLKFIFHFDFLSIELRYYLLAAGFYAVLTYIYIGIVNHDFVVYHDRIKVINRVPLFRAEKVFYFHEIKSVLFRHEWMEGFLVKFKPGSIPGFILQIVMQVFIPPDYKWIKLYTDKPHHYFCFGLEFDYYDNEGPYFEEFFYELAEKGIKVEWTNVKLNYYAGMMNGVLEHRKNLDS